MSSSNLHAGRAFAGTSRSERALAGAVVVFFHPDTECFVRANRLAAILPVIVVDNTPDASAERAKGLDPSIQYLASGKNAGIATALNEGVDALRARGFGHALLFDQDSEPSASLLAGLLDAIGHLAVSGRRVAVMGPAYEDVRLSGVAPFVRFGAWHMTRVAPVGTEPLEVDFLISSGSCIDLSSWLAVGPMDASLFIDFVDVEWCVRARRAGFSVLGLPWLTMQHSLGDEPVSVMGHRFAMHSAFRHYFLFRNAVALIVYRRYMPLSWKLTELVKIPVRLVLYPLLSKDHVGQLKMIGRGIVDGLRNRLGPLR